MNLKQPKTVKVKPPVLSIPFSERVAAAPCPHFGVCGGCSFQDVPYPAQTEAKENFFKETLNGLADSVLEPILASPDLWHYRNKMEFAFGQEGGRLTLGLHPRGRVWSVVDVGRCDILSEETSLLLEAARAWAVKSGLTPFHSLSGTGQLRHLVIREGKNTGQRMVNLISTSQLESPAGFMEALASTGVRIDTALWSRNDGVADVAQGDMALMLRGEGVITERLGPLEFRVTPYGFMQTNTHAAEMMVRELASWVEASGLLVDVYCGSGLLGLSFARRFDRLTGIEMNPVSVDLARQNAVMNGIENADFLCGAAEKLLPEILSGLDLKARVTLFVDPPRSGLHPKVVEALCAVKPQSLVYVSCNPHSLANDLRILKAFYTIERMQPMDFYPHTPHIESMTLLQRMA